MLKAVAIVWSIAAFAVGATGSSLTKIIASLMVEAGSAGQLPAHCLPHAGQTLTLPSLYEPQNDLPSQLAALTDFWNTAGGSKWQLDQFIPDITGALSSAPAFLLEFFTDPSITAAEKEDFYISSIFESNNTINEPLRLALYGLGLAKHEWFTPNTSYCTW